APRSSRASSARTSHSSSSSTPSESRSREDAETVVRLALKNPHAVVVLALIASILGMVSFAKTPVDVFPDLHVSSVVVALGYRGMPAAGMEATITRTLERAYPQADGVEHMESRSLVGIGIIKIFFRPEQVVNAAISQIVSLTAAEMRNLPPGLYPPY